MKRYILTGAPGSGKTLIIRALEMQGYAVIDEAATDVIAYEQALGNQAPWEKSSFIDEIVHLQKQREIQMTTVNSTMQFYDRSPFCTYALAVHMKYSPSEVLLKEIERLRSGQVYQKQVFFIDNLGFIKHTEARKINFEDSVAFEKIHAETYAKFGFECIKIPLAPLLERVGLILKSLETLQGSHGSNN